MQKKIKRRMYCGMWKFYEIQTLGSTSEFLLKYCTIIIYVLSVAMFMLQWHSWIVETAAIVPANPKLFTVWPFKKRLPIPRSALSNRPFCDDYNVRSALSNMIATTHTWLLKTRNTARVTEKKNSWFLFHFNWFTFTWNLWLLYWTTQL